MRHLGSRRRSLSNTAHGRSGRLIALESGLPLAGAARAAIYEGRGTVAASCAEVIIYYIVLANCFPIPLAVSSLRAQPARTPTRTNALHGRSRVVLFLEQEPVRVDPC